MEQNSGEATHGNGDYGRWAFHYTQDPLTRYLRDRRLWRALRHISSVLEVSVEEMRQWRVLITCGGVGG